MTVRFSPQAHRQLRDAIEFIGQERPSAARRFLARLERRLRALEDFPNSGRRVPEFPGSKHREVVIKRSRVFYRVVDDVVWVTTVFHSKRLPERPPE